AGIAIDDILLDGRGLVVTVLKGLRQRTDRTVLFDGSGLHGAGLIHLRRVAIARTEEAATLAGIDGGNQCAAFHLFDRTGVVATSLTDAGCRTIYVLLRDARGVAIARMRDRGV